MSWLQTMSRLEQELAEESPYVLSDELSNAVKLFKGLQDDVVNYGSKTNMVSPFWMEATRLLAPPINPQLVVMKALQEVAEQKGVPLTWLYLFPFQLQIDSAARHISFKSQTNIMYTDEDGYATSECLVAFHDGKEQGMIDEDEPFIFALNQFTEDYNKEANKAIETLSDSMGVTKKKFIEMASGESIDAPFPHENDDSPVGEA